MYTCIGLALSIHPSTHPTDELPDLPPNRLAMAVPTAEITQTQKRNTINRVTDLTCIQAHTPRLTYMAT